MEQIIQSGGVVRGWLGVSMQDMTTELADSFGLDKVEGALVGGVLKDGPADKAGIKPGDILIAIEGKQIRNSSDLLNKVAALPPGEAVTVKIIRKNRKRYSDQGWCTAKANVSIKETILSITHKNHENSFVTGFIAVVSHWFSANIISLGREMRLSYMPPLMVYVAAGISGLTGIVGVLRQGKLGLSAEFLAMLGFWMMLPWALKMPLGHLVDLMWRWKGLLVYLGASLIMLSLFIMIGLLGHTETMTSMASVETWFVISALLAPIGYVLQDVVADAMTVEAVPRVDENGQN